MRSRPYCKLVGSILALSLAPACSRPPVPATASEPLALFPPSAVPSMTNVDQGYDVELGVELWSDVDGTVNGVRFWKGSADTGPHLGHLWATDGTLEATAQFTNESASGWQEAHFLPAVAVKK